ncbi:MAG: SMC-Scp complex subunit ScpB [Actinomycetota bacterium]
MEQQETMPAASMAEPKRAIEAILLVSADPTPATELAQLLEMPVEVVEDLCRELAMGYDLAGHGFQLVEVAGGWRYQTHPDMAPYVERYATDGMSTRLSTAALETLAIVAYKQPISRAQVSAIRGVNVDAVLRTLVQRGYVEEVGRDLGAGQAILFGTTQYFLERVGLNATADLPSLGEFVPSADVVEALEQTLKVELEPFEAAEVVEAAEEGGEAVEAEVSGDMAAEAAEAGDVGETSEDGAQAVAGVDVSEPDAIAENVQADVGVDVSEPDATAENVQADVAEAVADAEVVEGAEPGADVDAEAEADAGVDVIADDAESAAPGAADVADDLDAETPETEVEVTDDVLPETETEPEVATGEIAVERIGINAIDVVESESDDEVIIDLRDSVEPEGSGDEPPAATSEGDDLIAGGGSSTVVAEATERIEVVSVDALITVRDDEEAPESIPAEPEAVVSLETAAEPLPGPEPAVVDAGSPISVDELLGDEGLLEGLLVDESPAVEAFDRAESVEIFDTDEIFDADETSDGDRTVKTAATDAADEVVTGADDAAIEDDH